MSDVRACHRHVGVRRIAAAVLLLTGCSGTADKARHAIVGGRAAPTAEIAASTTPVAGAGEWVTPGKNFAQTRFSGLTQITLDNVKNLKQAWTFSTGVLHGHEGAPLVVGSTMYLVTPFPDIAYALDLANPGTLKWTYHPPTDEWAIGVACCDLVNRGPSYADGMLVYNLLDNRTIALDANTGRVRWETKMGDVKSGMTMTMPPLVAHGKVLVGNSGGEMGVRGWIAALDLATGKQLWRAYNAGPDSLVKIGPRFRPFYPSLKGKDLGVTTWPPDAWKHGGATTWGYVSYDPDLDLLYYGTSNPGPWNQNQRPGDNKWSTTLFARDLTTGEAAWAYQFTPHDTWDFDGTNELILADLPIKGQVRHVLVEFNRNAFAYTIDRATGEVLVAEPFAYENWSTGVDLATGLPKVNADKVTRQGVNVQNICPSDAGGKDQQPAAFSPRTGLFYVPVNNLCMDYESYETSYIAGTPYWGAHRVQHPGPGGNFGEFMAWDASTGRKVWSIKEKFLVWGGVLVTASDLVFYGTADGWFRAVDARSGAVVWQQRLGSGILGSPIAYTGPDGKEYIAVMAGIGGGAAGRVADLPGNLPGGGMLYVFSL